MTMFSMLPWTLSLVDVTASFETSDRGPWMLMVYSTQVRNGIKHGWLFFMKSAIRSALLQIQDHCKASYLPP